MTILLADGDAARRDAMTQRCRALAPKARLLPADTPEGALSLMKTGRADVAVLNLECVSMDWAKRFHGEFSQARLLFTIDPAGRSREALNEAALAAYGLFSPGFLLLPIDWAEFDRAMEEGLLLASDAFRQVCPARRAAGE